MNDGDLMGIFKACKAHAKGKLGKKVAPLIEENFIYGRGAPVAQAPLSETPSSTV